MEVYDVIRDDPGKIYDLLCGLKRDIETYKLWRSFVPGLLDRETRAVRFVYLNRNCFNGIYRTNVSGQFNVPMGKRPGEYFSREDLEVCATLLKRATLIAGDFEKTISHVTHGDFVYLDPPYAVSTRRIFREYGKKVFDLIDIPRFSESLDFIHNAGADFLVSYADCRDSRAIAVKWNSVRMPVRRHIAGFAGARRNAYEIMITNLPIVPSPRARKQKSNDLVRI